MAKFDKFLGKIVERVVGDIIDPGVVPDASTTDKGIIQLATGAEVTAGTDTAKAVVPATLKTELDKKVDKVAGKGLSTNDYDNTEKAKVAAAETEATLGVDTASGDATKFLNQKKQWVVPAGGSGSAPDASTTDKGIIQLATGAEVTAGTDTAKAVVPATLKTELDKKVDKVAGKGLSTNDYDNTEKAKVAAAETEATLGVDTASGDATKFLNQKKQWVVPAGGSGSAPDASTTDKGIIQLATGAEVTAGTDTAKAVVPATLKTELDKKVDKVAGKGLSTNDYDNTEKAKVGKIELETLAELTGANVSVAPWTQNKWSASGTCSLTASGWAASGHQIAYIVITLAAEATPSVSGATVADEDALSAAGVYECYIKNVDGKKYFRVVSFTEAAS